MTTNPIAPTTGRNTAVGPRYALIPVHGYGIAVATVACMLDTDGGGATACVLHPGEPIPLGAWPVLLAETTVYGAICVERTLRSWHPQAPRPWLVLAADAPAPPPPDARYRIRALQSRLAGTASLPYLPSLRAVEGPEAALEHKDVKRAAAKLRRQLEGN
ncbi:hypothetical protein M1P56_35570 (plasmid) [Streptomyces sp. HU2014]|uniref:hypothetical protein n=1 Tax=Streptomyces sp. HU2014 TaxID=2939414 RepID=UPI00200DEFCC|nr:hypothetical protein [Streptomyces sp. HU2014]UQI49811.1 hypothetical protein M1P56_35570 [Streptomyces sp. HU2014]